MTCETVICDGVSKKFRRGERHDTLRDVLPEFLRRAFRKSMTGTLQSHEFWAVRDVSFTVAPGEALGVIGPNGAGKSTLLKLLTRILKPTTGECFLKGRVGALIEVAAGFHPDLTGRENIFLQGAIMGMKRTEIACRLEDIIQFSGIEAFIDTPVKRYSSGMNARLGFSIAAHLHPTVLIIDEVLAVGDVAFQDRCIRRMEYFLQQGVSMVFVSHNLHSVVQLCRRAMLLKDGESVLCGNAADVVLGYTTSTGLAPDVCGRDVRLSVSVRKQHAEANNTVRAGEEIRVSVSAQFSVDASSVTIGVVVRELTRNLYVYGASSDALGIPPLRVQQGTEVKAEFALSAHLTRGLYALEVNVFDIQSQQLLCVLNPAWQFNVAETISYGGLANLYLEALGFQHRLDREVECAC